MKEIKEALQLFDLNELKKEWAQRLELRNQMVGTLYPDILNDELTQIDQRYTDIKYGKIKVPKSDTGKIKVTIAHLKKIAELSIKPISELRHMNPERAYAGKELTKYQLIYQIVFLRDAPDE